VPVNSGSRPGAPLGGHSTKLPLRADPVEVAAPAVEALPRPVLPPPPPDPVPPLPPVVEVVALVDVDVVVPAAEVEFVVPEFCTLGSATTPPPAGKPLLSVALPTFPVVGVALCAGAVETRPIDRKRANPELRIMAGT
jgi:hypothetical protein